jgi:hypothetical protein
VGTDRGYRLWLVDAELMPILDVSSNDFESWMAGLAANQGPARQRIIKAFASVLGDKSVEWMTWANLEHLPAYASDQSIALIASERQLDTATGEAASSIAQRAPFWLQLAKFSGSGLGILLGLHFSGFDGAILIQQNGRALSLTLPLPPFVLGQTWDPTPNLVVTACNPLVLALTSSVTPGRSIPAGTPWFAFDSDTDFCSRFTVLFPGPLPSQFMTVGLATFTATDTASVTWNNAFADATYQVQPGIPTITDGGGPVSVVADLTTRTTTGVQLLASGSFTGTVSVLAWQTGANPYADLHPADVSRLRTTLLKWKPAKATCVNVVAIVAGELWDYPFGLTWDGDSLTWDQSPSSTVQVLGSF